MFSQGKEPDNDIIDVSTVTIDDLLRITVQKNASDLHITAGLPPVIRVDGILHPLNFTKLTPQDTQRLIYDILLEEQITTLETQKEIDFSYGIRDLGRFRVNVYRQRGSIAAALRVIPDRIPSFEELRLPPSVKEVAEKTSGLILVTGPTGSGKSTTLAAMIDHINETRSCHIITIENPIEYLHRHKRSMVNQREVGSDTLSFANALRAALREDPDVIMVGEMRDLETTAIALTAAETGHLVLATLHTRNAPQSIDRIIDIFPPHQQDQVRIQLAESIEAIFSQRLLPMTGGGRIVAVEVMIATTAVRNLIREGKTYQIYGVMETSVGIGMKTLDMALAELYREGYIRLDDAFAYSIDPLNLERLLERRKY
ncbi:MAG: type IV pilus twitching motility protein PilT [Candidatus Bathyarchaeia archaeon]